MTRFPGLNSSSRTTSTITATVFSLGLWGTTRTLAAKDYKDIKDLMNLADFNSYQWWYGSESCYFSLLVLSEYECVWHHIDFCVLVKLLCSEQVIYLIYVRSTYKGSIPVRRKHPLFYQSVKNPNLWVCASTDDTLRFCLTEKRVSLCCILNEGQDRYFVVTETDSSFTISVFLLFLNPG